MLAPSVRVAARSSLQTCRRCLHSRTSAFVVPPRPTAGSRTLQHSRLSSVSGANFATVSSRSYAAQSPDANGIVDELTELYENARDEFEMASEETEENTVYAEGDREAAQEELAKLKNKFEEVMSSNLPLDVREEVKKRTSHRIRELDNAMAALEAKAQSQD